MKRPHMSYNKRLCFRAGTLTGDVAMLEFRWLQLYTKTWLYKFIVWFVNWLSYQINPKPDTRRIIGYTIEKGGLTIKPSQSNYSPSVFSNNDMIEAIKMIQSSKLVHGNIEHFIHNIWEWKRLREMGFTFAQWTDKELEQRDHMTGYIGKKDGYDCYTYNKIEL